MTACCSRLAEAQVVDARAERSADLQTEAVGTDMAIAATFVILDACLVTTLSRRRGRCKRGGRRASLNRGRPPRMTAGC